MNFLRKLVKAGRLAMLAFPVLVTGAAAQSVYGCVDLAGRHNMPSIEGLDGVFYRIDPDLHMFHSLSEESVARLAALSRALAANGTTLIYIPVPTRGLAMPDQLPQMARDYGFDVDLATTVYVDGVRRLRDAKVVTADVRRALRFAAKEAPPFFATDPRLTPEGAEFMAGAIAMVIGQSQDFDAIPKSQFATQTGAPVVLPSDMRSRLQRHCMINLPKVEAVSSVTLRTQAAAFGTDSSIFVEQNIIRVSNIALIGTGITGSPVSNLAGFLSQATGLDVVQYSVQDGGSFAAMSSYLTSSAFRNAPPAYLVWTNPVDNNLAQYGDQPLRELTIAAAGNCPISLQVSRGSDINSLRIDLNGLDSRQPYSLYVDADGAQASQARFDFVSRTGLVRRKTIIRNPEQVKTGRFYMPLSGLWQEGATSVEILLDVPFGARTLVSACLD
ncbi:MAG: alginate biosynthesis protein AlgX [Paracoccaceae bacterium]|jgi:alginate biosynthesis protein AlgX